MISIKKTRKLIEMATMINKSEIYKKNLSGGAFALFLMTLFVLGCGLGGSSNPPAAEYVGFWTGADGSTLTIRADGSGDLKSGGSEVTNGSVEIKDGKLSVTLVGIGKTMNVDEPPKNGKMKLDGIVFSQSGSSQTDSKEKGNPDTKTSAEKSDASKQEVPSNEEAQELTKATLLEFNKAVQQEDFTDFHDSISKAWQQQITPQSFNKEFADFIEKQIDISEISSLDASFTSSPAVKQEQGIDMLILEGEYDTTSKTQFALKYIPEGKEWKLASIRVFIGKK